MNTQEHTHKHIRKHTRFLYPFIMKQTFRLLIFLGNYKKKSQWAKQWRCIFETPMSCPLDTCPEVGLLDLIIVHFEFFKALILFFHGDYSNVYPHQYYSKVPCPYLLTFVTLRVVSCLWHLMCMLFSAWVLWCLMISHPLGFICQACISFRGWVVFPCVSIGQFVYPCIMSGHSICFQVLAAI